MEQTSTMVRGRIPFSLRSFLDLIAEKLWIISTIFLLILMVLYRVLPPWNAVNYDVARSIGAMDNSTCHYLRYSNESNGSSIFKSSQVVLVNWSEVLQVAIELESEPELPNGNVISKMWSDLLDSVSMVMDSSQELNTRGNGIEVDYENLLSKIAQVLRMSSTQLEELEVSLSSARRLTASAHLSLYSTRKQLKLDSEQHGLARWLESHFRGDRAFRRRQVGLNLTHMAIQRANEVSQYLSGMEVWVKWYKDNIITVHNSIKKEQAEGCKKSRVSFCLLFLESIFNNLD
ncbi:uncharacterized protein PGTG_19670 [Puccinia graminis f. sp. tritici CRL 75-36-700-3]|uniref:Uncharacterized protein n=1 Tax=Puccinia graminis f. sp. tritici (strain CRL 75-36-700-3 / race SCCL) TaxID=418459 RepID=E3LAX6_PUCGT|nr:uncharacterized protein PGTG_19670 [Puccinia graminis f. sp. tritici CRL 75-36-700-3]EFP93701.2 hypothetical protein PGTG_19670 [Puccinia graminis f. sp. tritici CRL 75-36-700-3]